jgi:hypothetical protein
MKSFPPIELFYERCVSAQFESQYRACRGPILESVLDSDVPFFYTQGLKCLEKTILVHILLILSSTNNFTTIFKNKIASTAIFNILTSLG